MSLWTADAEVESLAAGLVVIGLRGYELQADERALIGASANVALFGRNVAGAVPLRRLCAEVRKAASGMPPLICVDREGGTVDRLRGVISGAPSAMALCAVGDPSKTRDAYEGLAAGALTFGANLLFAPVADVNVEPRNPVIGTRSFGDDPAVIAPHVVAAITGMQHAGAAACVKHFPGHGATPVDSHAELPRIDDDERLIERVHLPSFAAAIAGGVTCVMTAHVAVPALDPSGMPATWSRTIIEGVLRGSLGFDGVVVSDDLEMGAISGHADPGEAAVRAIDAGCDLVMFGSDITRAHAAIAAIAGALRSERLQPARARRSAERIAALRMRLAKKASAPYDDEAQRELAAALARRAVTIVRSGDVLPLSLHPGQRALVIDFVEHPDAKKASGDHQTPIGRALATTPARVQEQARSLEPSGHEYKQMLMAAGSAQLIVAITRGAFRRELQARAVADLGLFGAKLVVVAAAEPYDAAVAPESAAVIATYGDDEDALTAAAGVIVGRVAAEGQLPVRLPAHA